MRVRQQVFYFANPSAESSYRAPPPPKKRLFLAGGGGEGERGGGRGALGAKRQTKKNTYKQNFHGIVPGFSGGILFVQKNTLSPIRNE